MERPITSSGPIRTTETSEFLPLPIVALGPPDWRSLIGAILGAGLYFALAYISLSLSRFDTALATVWLPSAATVALLLQARLSNEAGLYALVFCASVLANSLSGNPPGVALVYSVANIINVALVTGLTRRSCGPEPDMRDLATLARFVWIGGMVGPITAASIAALAMEPAMPFALRADGAFLAGAVWQGAFNWFLTDSMGMILIVPTALLISRALRQWDTPGWTTLLEGAMLLGASLVCTLLVFSQNAYPLLFLIVPMTLLHAFRLGSTGTALHLTLITAVSMSMTWVGLGPIVATSASPTVQLHLIQAFIGVNFLTGLPIAAILGARERLTRELVDGRRELDLLANSITDAVLKLDGRGVCTYASPSVRDVLAREPGEFVGRPIGEIIHEDASGRMADVLARLLSGKVDKERFTYRRRLDDPGGGPVFIEADCAITLDPATKAREGVVFSARDVTERVELELLLTRARRQAEDAASAKSDFLANMSHEIRTPMNGVLGFAELMLQGDLDPEARRHTEMIVESGRSMMLLLNDILDLSKIEAGQIMIDTGPIDLHATLEECLDLHRQAARQKGLALRLEYDLEGARRSDPSQSAGELPCANLLPTIVTDGLRLRQIALNLIGNAVKFTESGSITVRYWTSETQLRVRVSDTGIGVSPDRLETIFEPFTQGESDTARRYGGTGLGLSISRQLAERLGGYIDVESDPGAGSTFTLTLPTTLVPPLEAKQAAAQSAPAAPPPLEDMPQDARVLLVEDHDVNRMLVTEMLERCGQSVATAQDGNEAISMVMDSLMRGRAFDLVLMDVQMPGCDGYAATRAIRDAGVNEETLPIIALTANAYSDDVAAAREAGMQAHLAKPIAFADLARTLQRWLPTRIVEAPMDRDVGDTRPVSEATPAMEGSQEDRTQSQRTGSRPLVQKWLNRRTDAVETLRSALASGLVANENKRRAVDHEEREALLAKVHKLAGSAASFGEAELGCAARRLEQAMRDGFKGAACEALAFELLALADEPEDEDAKAAALSLDR